MTWVLPHNLEGAYIPFTGLEISQFYVNYEMCCVKHVFVLFQILNEVIYQRPLWHLSNTNLSGHHGQNVGHKPMEQ